MKTKLYLPDGLVSENPFWFFSLSLWEDSELRKQLLWLQNTHAMRISLLLYSTWAACEKRYVQWQTLKSDQILTQWQTHMVDPLRSVRMKLAGDTDSVAIMKKRVQAAELQAEQWEMAILHHALANFTQYRADGSAFDALITNLLVYTDKNAHILVNLQELVTRLLQSRVYQEQINEVAPVGWERHFSGQMNE